MLGGGFTFALLVSATPFTFKVEGEDLSALYKERLVQNSEFTLEQETELKAKIGDSKILFVTGFFSSDLKKAAQLPIFRRKLGQYFEEQVIWFKALGLKTEMVDINSDQPPSFNLPLIEKSILRSEKPVIILTHSKGGIDLLHTLIHSSRARKLVKGWIAFNAPFQGSPIADLFFSNSKLTLLTAKVMEMLGGSLAGVASMLLEQRKIYLEENAAEIARVLKDVPLISFGAYRPNQRDKIDTAYELQRNYLERRGYQTDGMVPWQSAILPGSKYIIVRGLDHTAAVQHTAFVPIDRLLITRTLLDLMLNYQTAKPLLAEHFASD